MTFTGEDAGARNSLGSAGALVPAITLARTKEDHAITLRSLIAYDSTANAGFRSMVQIWVSQKPKQSSGCKSGLCNRSVWVEN